MQVLIAVALRVASRWSPGQTAVGEGGGRQSEFAKLRGSWWTRWLRMSTRRGAFDGSFEAEQGQLPKSPCG